MKNCLKNPHYKSTLQFYNRNSQNVAATNIITNPLIPTLIGNIVTDTGVAISTTPTNIVIENAGTYQLDFNIIADVTATGTLTFALVENGNIMPETITSGALEIGENFIDIHTVRNFKNCCDNTNIYAIAYSDGSATATLTKISGSGVKLA